MSLCFVAKPRLDGRIEALKRELSNENLGRSGSKSKSPLRDNYYRLVSTSVDLPDNFFGIGK